MSWTEILYIYVVIFIFILVHYFLVRSRTWRVRSLDYCAAERFDGELDSILNGVRRFRWLPLIVLAGL